MASKKILLEVLTTDRNRVAPASPRPKREKEERRREKRASRPLSLPHPSTQSLLLVLAGVVVMVVAYGVGFRVGRNAGSTPLELSTSARVPDLLDQASDERLPPKPIAAPPAPAVPAARTEGVRHGVQVVSYEPGQRNADRARNVKKELEAQGLPNVMAWENTQPPLAIFITVGSFPTAKDPGLEALLAKVRAMPFGTEKTPFAGATVRTLPVP